MKKKNYIITFVCEIGCVLKWPSFSKSDLDQIVIGWMTRSEKLQLLWGVCSGQILSKAFRKSRNGDKLTTES